MSIQPDTLTRCYFVLNIGNEAYLLDHDPSEKMNYPEDADHLYRKIVEGIFYPSFSEESDIAGYFLDIEDNEYITFKKHGFYTDAEWKGLSEEFLVVRTYWDDKNTSNK